MAFDTTPTSVLSGGPELAINQYTDADENVKFTPYSQIYFGADRAVPTVVNSDVAAHGLPVQVIDGADASQGSKEDGAANNSTSAWSVVALLKGLYATLVSGIGVAVSNFPSTQPVSGTVAVTGAYQATQPVSLAALPALTAGAAKIGVVTTDQTTHGTTDLVAADITKVAGTAIAQGHGTAATAIRVELPTDGTGVLAGVTTVTTVMTVSAVTAITNALPAGSNLLGKVGIDQTTPGTTNAVTAHTNVYRNGGALHRSAVTVADKLIVPSTPTLAAVTEAGSTLANVAYNVTVSAGNIWGPTGCPATAAITPTANQAVRVTFGQTTGATYYDIFLSTGTSPLWVGRITETQRASGGFIISTVGTVTSGGGAGAGAVDIGIVGTQVACNTIPFAFNNAYTPTTPSVINCAGYSKAYVMALMTVTDLRSLPTLTLVPFRANQTTAGDMCQDAPLTLSLLTANGTCLAQEFEVDVDGSIGLVILVDTIGGQGPSVNVWVELA